MTTSPPRPTSGRTLTGRHVLVLFIGFFGVVFATNIAMVSVAVGTFPGTEVASSYRAGRQYPAELAAARAQAERGWQVEVGVVREAGEAVTVRYEPRDAAGTPIAGLAVTMRLEHPADRHRDREVTLAETRGGVYAAQIDAVPPGQWLVVSEARRDGERVHRSRNRTAIP